MWPPSHVAGCARQWRGIRPSESVRKDRSLGHKWCARMMATPVTVRWAWLDGHWSRPCYTLKLKPTMCFLSQRKCVQRTGRSLRTVLSWHFSCTGFSAIMNFCWECRASNMFYCVVIKKIIVLMGSLARFISRQTIICQWIGPNVTFIFWWHVSSLSHQKFILVQKPG